MALFNKLFKKKEEEEVKKAKKEIEKKIEKPVKRTEEKKQDEKIKKETTETYRILEKPWITEKTSDLINQNRYVFKVFSDVGKAEVKQAVEALYKVQVTGVNIINIHSKERRFGRRRQKIGYKSGYKKAIVKLKEGQKIEIMPH